MISHVIDLADPETWPEPVRVWVRSKAKELRGTTEKLSRTFELSNVFATKENEHREGQVCLVLGIETLNDQVEMVRSLLTWWGGEAMYMSRRSLAVRARLREIGRPSIIVAAIDLSRSHWVDPTYPLLPRAFVGSFLGPDVLCDVFLGRTSRVSGFWRSGNLVTSSMFAP